MQDIDSQAELAALIPVLGFWRAFAEFMISLCSENFQPCDAPLRLPGGHWYRVKERISIGN